MRGCSARGCSRWGTAPRCARRASCGACGLDPALPEGAFPERAGSIVLRRCGAAADLDSTQMKTCPPPGPVCSCCTIRCRARASRLCTPMRKHPQPPQGRIQGQQSLHVLMSLHLVSTLGPAGSACPLTPCCIDSRHDDTRPANNLDAHAHRLHVHAGCRLG